MVLDSRPGFLDVPCNVELCWVGDTAATRDFADVAADGLAEEATGLSDLIRATFSDRRSLVASDTAALVVRYRSEPVATASTMVKEGVAWIGWVATRPRFRGRGFARLATAAAVRAGFTLGAKFASLEATTMGVPVYSKLGFREVVRYCNYWPARFGR
jgi:GNAT superfamily N-acetyltransferase